MANRRKSVGFFRRLRAEGTILLEKALYPNVVDFVNGTEPTGTIRDSEDKAYERLLDALEVLGREKA